MTSNADRPRLSYAVLATDDLARVLHLHSLFSGIVTGVAPGRGGRRANLKLHDLRGADLSGADLAGADLTGSWLGGADLSGADLSHAVMYGADLRGARMHGACLAGADMRGCLLAGVWLDDADLSDADLRGGILWARLPGGDLTPTRARAALAPMSAGMRGAAEGGVDKPVDAHSAVAT